MQGLTNLSMRWLNYPAKMLFKSSRIIPTMIVGVLYMKKSYKVRSHIRDDLGIDHTLPTSRGDLTTSDRKERLSRSIDWADSTWTHI